MEEEFACSCFHSCELITVVALVNIKTVQVTTAMAIGNNSVHVPVCSGVKLDCVYRCLECCGSHELRI